MHVIAIAVALYVECVRRYILVFNFWKMSILFSNQLLIILQQLLKTDGSAVENLFHIYTFIDNNHSQEVNLDRAQNFVHNFSLLY